MTEPEPQWHWQHSDAEGQVLVRPPSPMFVERYAAEEWLGLHWRTLRDQQVAGTVLVHRDRTVGPRYDLRDVPEQMTYPRDATEPAEA